MRRKRDFTGTLPFRCTPVAFAFDRGCLHAFDDSEERARFAARVGALLESDGIWNSLIGSTDGPPRDTGPPRRSATEIATAVEPHFEVVELRSTFLTASNTNSPARGFSSPIGGPCIPPNSSGFCG